MSEQVTPTRRRAAWRWAVPGVIAAAVAVTMGVRPVVADASPALPHRTAAELLASLPDAANHPFSGTVTTTARLGLPELPGSVQGQHAPLSAATLLTGTHTLRVWYAGPDRQRVALVGDLAEADVVHNGQDVWAWNSDTRGGVHLRLPDHGSATKAPALPQDRMGDLTPQRLAQQLLSAVDPTTKVTVDGTASVAGRDAYELVVAPRDNRSLIHQIRLAVDARTSLPLRLQVFSSGSSDPALETGFTSISYDTPSASVFKPPSGQLSELTAPSRDTSPPPRPTSSDLPTVIGSGWTTVVTLSHLPDLAALAGGAIGAPSVRDGSGLAPRPQGKGDTDGSGSQPSVPAPGSSTAPSGPLSGPADGSGSGMRQGDLVAMLLRSATPVSGSFGSGRLLRTALVSVLVLDDGHVFVGAVTPQTLEQAASGRS